LVIYLDSSAAVKLVRHEPDSDALSDWLDDHANVPMASSVLIEVELVRALRRRAPEAVPRVPSLLARLYRLEIDRTVRDTAASYSDPLLRSLDAIHLATAQLLAMSSGEDFVALVTYDQRLLEVARSIELAAVAPTTSSG
jgi:predicted nucleic acid-binding protein